MFKSIDAFCGFSVKDKATAKQFYRDVLGLEVSDSWMGLEFTLPGGLKAFAYEKQDHKPATYTILNFVVTDIDSTVADLKERGVTFEKYDNLEQDNHGVLRGLSNDKGPDIAWFKDPSGNIFAVLQAETKP